MNMACFYPIIYWNTANLIVDSASDEDNEGGTTDYGKIGVAISNMQKQGVTIGLPLINEAKFSFVPDEKNNRIIYALKGMNGIGDEAAKAIVENAPYSSIEDFCDRMVGKESKLNAIGNAQMLQLIKGGCFTELHNKDRRVTMDWYLKNKVFSPCESLGLQQLGKVRELHIIPSEVELAERMVNFKKYVLSDEFLIERHIDKDKKMVKRGYHDGYYLLDKNSQPFFKEHFREESIVKVKGEFYVVSEKKFTKEVDSYIQPLKDWLADPKTADIYNKKVYEQIWNKYASGTVPHWNMAALTFYDDKHELADINKEEYGVVNFFDLPEDPEPYEWYIRYINGEPKQMYKYKISCITGTVVETNKNRHTVSLLTTDGIVSVKFSKGTFAYYSKRISEEDEAGKNRVIEDSWLKRGSLIRCIGFRDGEQFRLKKYSDTVYSHTINLITQVNEDGTIEMQYERYGGN